MATVKKGNEGSKKESTKRRRTKATGTQPGAEKLAATAPQPNHDRTESKAATDPANAASHNGPAQAARSAETTSNGPMFAPAENRRLKTAADAADEAKPNGPAPSPVLQAARTSPPVEPAAAPMRSKPVFEPAVTRPAVQPAVTAVRADPEPVEATRTRGLRTEPDVEAIRARAYQIFLARGATHGNDLEDWLAAERQLRKETAAN